MVVMIQRGASVEDAGFGPTRRSSGRHPHAHERIDSP
jgi:hypothetical protein